MPLMDVLPTWTKLVYPFVVHQWRFKIINSTNFGNHTIVIMTLWIAQDLLFIKYISRHIYIYIVHKVLLEPLYKSTYPLNGWLFISQDMLLFFGCFFFFLCKSTASLYIVETFFFFFHGYWILNIYILKLFQSQRNVRWAGKKKVKRQLEAWSLGLDIASY